MATMELKNMQVWVDDEEGTFRRWSGEEWEVIVQEFDGFAYILRLDVEGPHRGKGLGTAIVQTLKDIYGTLIASPASERSRGFFAKLGVEDERGELKGQAIWPLDQGYGVFIVE
jgi:GNAT superfamily N-acetyltransferase